MDMFWKSILVSFNDTTGSLEKAVQASSKVLAVQGQVLPATNTDDVMNELEDGEKIFGKVQ